MSVANKTFEASFYQLHKVSSSPQDTEPTTLFVRSGKAEIYDGLKKVSQELVTFRTPQDNSVYMSIAILGGIHQGDYLVKHGQRPIRREVESNFHIHGNR